VSRGCEVAVRSFASHNLNSMTKRHPRSQPKWTDVKAKLAGLDRIGLIGLIQDLYSAHKDNQAFLHTRFGLGENVLEPYMKH
jgi:hypothetical protein